MTGSTPSSRRVAVFYVSLLVGGAVVLAVVFAIGRGLQAAPELAEQTTVGGTATSCLGEELAALQSGVHLDLHVTGASASGGQVGARLLRGEVDDTGEATLDGQCAAGSRFEGAPAAAAFHVRDEAATGWVEVDGRRLDLALRPADQDGAAASATDEDHLETSALVARVFLAVALIIVAARVVGYLFGRIRQPRVMGEIVAGIMLGPSLLGAIAPSVSAYLFPSQVIGVLEIVGQFGLIFFMFLVGLELNRRLVVGLGHSVVLLSHVSIVVPFVAGAALALVLYPRVGNGEFGGVALFLGAAMAITAFPVLARILSDTGLNRTRLGALAITCAAVDDLSAWCILAAVVAVVASTGPADVLTTLALTALFVGAMVVVGRPLLRRAAQRLQRQGRLDSLLVPGVFTGVLLSAWATEMIGIHAIFGGFIFGVVMPRPRWLKADLQGRLEDVTLLLLLPVFFAVVGLSTRISLLDSPELWAITVAVTLVAIAGKLGGCLIAARFEGYPWRDSGALGLLMNTRGLTEIVILTVGQRLGVVSPALFAVLVLMALATTLMAAPLLSLIYPSSRIRAEADAQVAAALTPAAGGGGPHPHVVAWLTGQPNDSGVYELAAALAHGSGARIRTLQPGQEAGLAEALDGAVALVVSSRGLATELAVWERSRELMETTPVPVLTVEDSGARVTARVVAT